MFKIKPGLNLTVSYHLKVATVMNFQETEKSGASVESHHRDFLPREVQYGANIPSMFDLSGAKTPNNRIQ